MRILVHHDGQQLGPYTLDEARAALAAGTLRTTDLAWQEGTPNWVPLASLLAGAGGAPPIPGAAPQPALLLAGAQTSGLAITSLILGIVSIVFCLTALSGIPAVICGHIARSQIGRSGGALTGAGMALAGLITGYLGTLSLPILAALAIPAFTAAKHKAVEAQDLNQARQIVMACQTYANDHDGNFPAALEELVTEGHLASGAALESPLLKQPGTVGYLYFGAKPSDPSDKVLFASKAKTRQGKRIVARVDGTVQAERYEPPAGGE